MKKFFGILIMCAVTTLILYSCKDATGNGDSLTQTKEECLSQFFTYINNSNWTSMYTMIHPDNSNRDSYKTGTTFDTIFDDNATYSISSISGSIYTLSVSPDGVVLPGAETYTFKEDGSGYWLILSFTDNTGASGGPY